MAHPFVAMFHEEIAQIIDEYEEDRFAAAPIRGSSLVVILRGLPGSGKSTFAAMMKMYAECKGLRTVVCSADDAFRGPNGYNFNTQGIRPAHAESQEKCRHALLQRILIVIIDNTNVKTSEWTPYMEMAEQGDFLHQVCRVNFRCHDDQAQVLRARSFHEVPFHTVARRNEEHSRHNAAYRAHYEVDPIQDFANRGDAEAPGRVHVMERLFFLPNP